MANGVKKLMSILCALSLLGTLAVFADGSVPQTQVINVLEDAHVESPKPDENYGSSSALLMRQGSRHAYLRFDLSEAVQVLENPEIEIESAMLTLTVAGDDRNGTVGLPKAIEINLYTLDSGWKEGTITYNNAPKFVESMLESNVTIPAGVMKYPVNIELVDSVKSVLAAGGRELSFGMQVEKPSSAYAYFFCRDSKDTSYQPKLTLAYRDKIYRDAIVDVEVTQDGGFVNAISSGRLDCSVTVQNWAETESNPAVFGALYRAENGTETLLSCQTDNGLSLAVEGRGAVPFSFDVPNDGGEYFLRFWVADGLDSLNLFSGETVFDKSGLRTQYPQQKGSCAVNDAVVGLDRNSGKVTVTVPEQTSERQIILLVKDENEIAYAGVMNGGEEKAFYISTDAVRRKYQVYLKSRDAETVVIKPLDYYLDSSFAQAFAEIAAAKTEASLKTAVDKYNDLLLIDRDSTSDESAVLKWLCGQKFERLELFIDGYQRCVAVQQFQSGNGSQKTEEIFEQYLASFQVDKRILTAIVGEGYPDYMKAAVLNGIAENKWSFDNACSDMQRIILVKSFQAAPKYSDIQRLFEDAALFAPYYKQTLESDRYYGSLKNKNTFYKYFIQQVSELTDERSIVSAIASASKKAYDDENSTGGSSSGGGGGGGRGSSGGKTTAVYEMAGTQTQQTTEPPIQNNTPSALYQDMKEAAWAEESVRNLTENGIISGDGNGYFRPNDSIKREEFVKMLAIAFDLQVGSGENVFADVPADSWAVPYVLAAYENGVVTGMGDGRFGFGNNLTREEMAVICYRMLKDNFGETNVLPQDLDMVSDYARKAVCALYGGGLLRGDKNGRFAPRQSATRAEACKFLCSVMEEVENR